MFKIHVKTNQQKAEITEKEGFYIVSIKERPEKGKANKRIIEMLAERFAVRKQDIRIVSGEAANRKIIEIER